MVYKGSDYYCDDSIVLRAMKEAKKTGVILMVHAESAASLIPSVIACVVLGLMILIFIVLSH